MEYIRRKDVIAILKEYTSLKGEEKLPGTTARHGSCCTCQICGHFHDDCVCTHNEILEWLDGLESVMVESKRFPMQDGPDIDWITAEKIYAVYSGLYGTDQSLERIAERGGFGWKEVALMWNS